MLGGVTHHMLPHLHGVPHLDVNRPQVSKPQGLNLKNPQVAQLEKYSHQLQIFSHQFV